MIRLKPLDVTLLNRGVAKTSQIAPGVSQESYWLSLGGFMAMPEAPWSRSCYRKVQ